MAEEPKPKKPAPKREGKPEGAHGGAPLADFIRVGTLHGWVCFTRQTGEEPFHQQSASADRQTERFFRDHFNSKSHAPKVPSAGSKIKTHVG